MDQKDANAKDLKTAQENLTHAQADVAAVSGLTQAVSNLTAAQDNTVAAEAYVTPAQANVAGAAAAYNVLNKATVSVGEDGTVAGLIVLNDNGDLVLAKGVTETTNKGVTELLNASIAKEAADSGLVNAQDAEVAAQKVVNELDLTDTAKADLQAVGAKMGLADGALPTAAQIDSEIARLDKLVETTKATADLTDVVALAADATAAATDADAADAALTDAVALRADATAAAMYGLAPTFNPLLNTATRLHLCIRPIRGSLHRLLANIG